MGRRKRGVGLKGVPMRSAVEKQCAYGMFLQFCGFISVGEKLVEMKKSAGNEQRFIPR
jgi:hypothetical protein